MSEFEIRQAERRARVERKRIEEENREDFALAILATAFFWLAFVLA